MEIEIFTLAEFATDHGAGKLNIIGTFDRISSHSFPTVHPAFSVAARIRLSKKEAGSHQFELKFKGPDGNEFLPPIASQLEFKPNLKDDYGIINFTMNFGNVRFLRPGRHGIELYADGDFKSGLHLNLIQGLPGIVGNAA